MISNIDKKHFLFNFIAGILFLFLVVFPKGGIKIFNIPFTWGYMLLALISLMLLIRKKYSIKKEHAYILISLIPFQLYSFISIWINKIESMGFAISFFTGFFVLPFIMLFVFSHYIQNLDPEFFFKIFRKSILFIASYGIFLFFYKIIFGSLIEIPLLTINYHDKGLMESVKSIDRGIFFKLISTYNNGNLYGICILMLLPLYNYLEKSCLKRSIVKLSLILTLSRTVWFGLIISEFFFAFFIKKNKAVSLIKFVLSCCFFLAIILVLAKKMNWDISWFLDTTLGNRINGNALEIQLLSSPSPFRHIEEMLYNGILRIFGIAGLIFFIIGFFSPLFIFLFKLPKNQPAAFNKTVFIGLLTYLIVSISDSAILYIPVLVIYWLLSSLVVISLKISAPVSV